MRTDKEVERLRRMLDPKHWPVKPGEYVICNGDVIAWRTDDPEEERIYHPLHRWP